MLAKFAVVLATLTALVAAIPTPGGSYTYQCNTGDAQCCKQTLDSQSGEAQSLASTLGLVLDPLDALVGLNCNSILGLSSTCSQQPVCCTGNNMNGLVVLGCSSVSA